MKGMLTALMIALTPLAALAESLFPQEGRYEGQAQWISSDGSKGEYGVAIEVAGNTLNSRYEIPGVENKQLSVTAQSDNKGFFELEMQGAEVGWGYCLQVQCHYVIGGGEFQVEETLTFVGDSLFRIGSKGVGSNRIAWSESLSRVK